MRILFLWVFLCTNVAFAAEDFQCIFGNPARNFHAKAAAGKLVEPGSFLENFVNARNEKLCNPPLYNMKSVFSMIKDRMNLNFGIRRDCIRESMSFIHEIQVTNRMHCENDDSNFEDSKQYRGKKKNKDVCLTEDMVDYTHFTMNKAIKCVNAILDEPLDPEVVMMVKNKESKGGYYLQNDGGIGIGQLTSVAMDEMVRRAGKIYLEKALESPSCSDFHNVLSRPVEFDVKLNRNGKPKKDRWGFDLVDVEVCQLVNPQNGVARNMFFSLAHFAHKRDTSGRAIGRTMRKLGITGNTKINYLAIEAYGAGSESSALSTLKSMWLKEGDNYLAGLSTENLIDTIDAAIPGAEKRINEHYRSEQSKVIDNVDVLKYMNTKEAKVFKENVLKPFGIQQLNAMSNSEFLDSAGEFADYLNGVQKSYNNLIDRLGDKGKMLCYAPLAFQ